MIDSQLISISLFSGAFGLDLGIEQAGFHTVSVVESDHDCTKTIALNRPDLFESAIPRDICSVNTQKILEEGGRVLGLDRPLYPGEVDLVTGGPPCQPFSTAGKRASVGDPRGSLFKDFIRIVREIQPRFFLMENVRGLLSAPIRHRPHNKRGNGYPPLEADEQPGSALQVILSEIEEIGYHVVYRLLQAADYGVPQSRLRVIFIASKEQEKITFPVQTHHETGAYNLPQWLTLKEALENLIDTQPEYIPYSEKRLKYLQLLKAGQNWRFLPDNFKKEAMGGAYNSGGGKVGFYRRLSWDKVSPTITTSPHQKATDMCHPEELRPLSVRECARLQSFPDDWLFDGSITSKYRQIGNAVPVKLGKAIGEHLYKIITNQNTPSLIKPYQLSIFEIINSCQKTDKIKSIIRDQTENFMKDKNVLSTLFKDAGVRRYALLAEQVSTLDKYINITEEDLKNIRWIDKKGKDEQMIKDKEIESIILKRTLYLEKIEKFTEQKNQLISTAILFKKVPVIKSILESFVTPNKTALDIAKKIGNVEERNWHTLADSNIFNNLSDPEREEILNFFLQKEQWNYLDLVDLPRKIEILANSCCLRAKFNKKDKFSVLLSGRYQLDFKKYLLKNWFRLKAEPTLFLEVNDKVDWVKNDDDVENLKILNKIFTLGERNLDLILLFLDEVVRLKDNINKIASAAIQTGNPFLFRSLFLDIEEAKVFAVGGKVNSSLETKSGNLFEKLMNSFGHCRVVNNGGIDVVVGQQAFDIKSGPNVMNKSMVDAFSAKQELIQQRNLLPDIKAYKVALGYGRREKLNSFMAKIDSEILPAREAWSEITGLEYSPEIVFAISGLIPIFFGVKSIVSAAMNPREVCLGDGSSA